jgi:hypothetical protein
LCGVRHRFGRFTIEMFDLVKDDALRFHHLAAFDKRADQFFLLFGECDPDA